MTPTESTDKPLFQKTYPPGKLPEEIRFQTEVEVPASLKAYTYTEEGIAQRTREIPPFRPNFTREDHDKLEAQKVVKQKHAMIERRALRRYRRELEERFILFGLGFTVIVLLAVGWAIVEAWR